MTHSFDVELAKMFGIEEAVFIDKFVGWIQHNRVNNKNYHDGRTWTFNSAKAFTDIFPYMSESKIKRVVSRLVEIGVLLKGNYNENQYDRTSWYAFSDEGYCIVQKYYFHSSIMTNGKVQNGPTIPNNQPIYQPNNIISFTPSDEGSDGDLFADDANSTLTMLSSEKEIIDARRADKPTAEEMDGWFEELWLAYERKGSKAKARKEFDKLTKEEIATMRLHIPPFLQSRPERQYRPDFERYIKNKVFNSVVYSKANEMLFDPEAPDTSVTREVIPEPVGQSGTITINGHIYR